MKTVSGLLCWVTFLFDLLLPVTVFLLLGYGIWLFIPFIHVLDTTVVVTTFIVVISFGVMISLASLVGCLGTLKKNCGILFSSASFNIFVVLMLLNFIIGVCFSRQPLEGMMKTNMYTSLTEYNGSCSNGYSTLGWDRLQSEYECCGVIDYTDWFKSTHVAIPYSCSLKDVRKDKPMDFLKTLRRNVLPKYVNKNGCYTVIQRKIDEHKMELGLVGLVFEFLIIVAITLTCYLGKKLRDIDEYIPQFATEDFQLTNIVRRNANRVSQTGSIKGSRIDRIRTNLDPQLRFNKGSTSNLGSIHDERLINYTKL